MILPVTQIAVRIKIKIQKGAGRMRKAMRRKKLGKGRTFARGMSPMRMMREKILGELKE
jgi:hypothetical protein